MSQALYRTWRPRLWEEVVGQEPVVQTLRNAIATNRVGHAYLFAGPRGTGKTTSARLLAKAVNCLHEDAAKRPCDKCENCEAVNAGRFLDLIEIDAASNTSVDDIRDLRDKVGFAPSQGKYKVYIIDEVHMLSTSAFNALLKTLEEPPAHVIFILATTEIHKIPATVLSRCQRHEFRRIPVQTIVENLKPLCEKENIDIEEEALHLIARQSTGSLRDATSLVDQLSSMSSRITLSIAQDMLGTATSQTVVDLTNALLDQDSGKGLTLIHQALDGGADPRQFARQIVDYLRSLLTIKLGAGKTLEVLPELRGQMTTQSKAFDQNHLVATITRFSEAATDLKANWHPGLGLELAYAASCLGPQTETTQRSTTSVATKTQAPPIKTTVPPVAVQPVSEATPVEQAVNPVHVQEAPKAVDKTAPLTFEIVSEQWESIKRSVRSENTICHALLNSSSLKEAQANNLTLNFKSDLLCEKMNEEKNLRSFRKVLSSIFGREIQVVCTSDQSSQNKPDFIPGGLVELTEKELGGKVRRLDNKKKE